MECTDCIGSSFWLHACGVDLKSPHGGISVSVWSQSSQMPRKVTKFEKFPLVKGMFSPTTCSSDLLMTSLEMGKVSSLILPPVHFFPKISGVKLARIRPGSPRFVATDPDMLIVALLLLAVQQKFDVLFVRQEESASLFF